mmetsp:Transcript_15947/g.23376  ORF Transcript_15947/g.23376 Transcript_15947/m.23376 type:complete len:511 (+) Transcript_15947:212-1744(+)|eukprot:CAMPEP_0195512056 /NCGR_PEP_ID=MMETSP0794_2-20130614/4157_1 /TAXON_ID=515487 /ORGANISM="Stephanopyxis turris, Strain CCMP 815" /LENGTH=510 /DNA_ID=CAMNT_0040639775 /DNA_START=204 /DNA_END=1736 /DNA_ORIENTATION=-
MKRFLIALALSGLVDAISYMVVSPSILFYVLNNGGTTGEYGFILSVFSFASFCTKPLLGWWSDIRGFREPFIVSISISAIGGLAYVGASALPNGIISVAAITLGRVLGGVGAANSALGYAYCAKVIPRSEQTTTNSLLSMMRMVGMAIGPGFNAFLGNVNLDLLGGRVKLDSLNSVGLVMVGCDLLAMLAIIFLLEEPSEDGTSKNVDDRKDEEKASTSQMSMTTSDLFWSVLSLDILTPFLILFTFNAAFQLVETAFAPATSHALVWGPVQISTVLGAMSFVVMFMMLAVSQLSSRFKISDPSLLCVGLFGSALTYGLIYFLWKMDAQPWHFYVPTFASSAFFPFMSAPTRSIFTSVVDSKPMLKDNQGMMQAMLSMAASVAGFAVPGFTSTICLKDPDVVEGTDGRELTIWSLFSPVLFMVSLACVIHVDYWKILSGSDGGQEKQGLIDGKGEVEQHTLDEGCPLLKTEQHADRSQRRRSFIEIHRQSCSHAMGFSEPTYGDIRRASI